MRELGGEREKFKCSENGHLEAAIPNALCLYSVLFGGAGGAAGRFGRLCDGVLVVLLLSTSVSRSPIEKQKCSKFT